MKIKLDTLKLIVFDFDGVFTNNKVYLSEDGTESVRCDRSDGLGIELLRSKTEISLLVMSKERNQVVQRRCDKLKLECYHAVDDKPIALRKIIVERNLDFSEVAFVGNDLNDVECMKLVGVSACPKDAYPCAKESADIILEKNGGDGAVREFCEMVLNEKQ